MRTAEVCAIVTKAFQIVCAEVDLSCFPVLEVCKLQGTVLDGNPHPSQLSTLSCMLDDEQIFATSKCLLLGDLPRLSSLRLDLRGSILEPNEQVNSIITLS